MIREIDENFMKIALQLAKKRKGYTHPNPTVGAVVVKHGRILGIGYHEKAGSPHAEVMALSQAGGNVSGSTLYVTLEPCTHYGRTPPCTDLIIEKKVARVVIATLDPNPFVAGKGVEKLRKHGISVDVGVMEKEAKELNEDFFTYITKRRPYITLKWAQTIDGKLATSDGSSKWLTSFESRELAHTFRREATAVLVGIKTVLSDNPQLTVRYVPTEKQPIRIVIDPKLEIPTDAKIVVDKSAETWIITLMEGKKKELLEKLGVRVFTLKDLKLPNLMKFLFQKEIMHLMVEGGAYTLSQFIKEKLYDRVCVFVAPKLMGDGKSFENFGVKRAEELKAMKLVEVKKIGEDVLLVYKP